MFCVADIHIRANGEYLDRKLWNTAHGIKK